MNLQVQPSNTGISESQLEVWSRQGAQTTASATYQSIKTALSRTRFRECVSPEVYLQGSYRNSTNIRGNSDVDIVAQLDSVYIADTGNLRSDEKQRYERDSVPATYTFDSLRSDVIQGLRDYYGTHKVTPKSKCIQVGNDGSGNRLTADVVPCLQYRKYLRYEDQTSNEYIEGMTFQTIGSPRQWIVNHPKLHYANGVTKNSNTGGRFKPTVRLFKNARDRYNETRTRGINAPSYFVAGLLSNVPNERFGGSLRETYLATLRWLAGEISDERTAARFLSQNGQVLLFGTGPDQWSVEPARRFVGAMVELWEKN